MKVFYDYQTFFQTVGGVSRYFCELAKNMPHDIDCVFTVCESDNVYLREKSLMPDLPYCRLTPNKFFFSLRGKHKLYNFFNKHFQWFPSFEHVNKKYSMERLKNSSFDVFHATLYDDYFLPYLNGKPFVVTVHDMIWELRPSKGNAKWSKDKYNMCEKASHIIAISECTKKDLVRLWGIPEEKITVVYHGGPEVRSVYDRPSFEYPYFLFVGRRASYKNFAQTLKDFAEFHKYHPEVKLVCTGHQFTSGEQRLIKELGVEDSLVCRFVSDEELANLYHYSLAFIFPSIYEGFGLPILESFAYGALALLNNASCFPEIGGDAAIYFNSNINGESDLAKQMKLVYSMTEEQRKAYIAKGYERLKLFTWKKCAEETCSVYHKVLNK